MPHFEKPLTTTKAPGAYESKFFSGIVKVICRLLADPLPSFQELQEDRPSAVELQPVDQRRAEQEDHFWQKGSKEKKNSVDQRDPPGFKKLSKLGEGDLEPYGIVS